MRVVRRDEAVGRRVAHDLTQVVPGEVKRVVLRRGDVVREEHLALLADMGKEHVWVLDDRRVGDGFGASEETAGEEVHENDAAVALATRMAGVGVRVDRAVEGKCGLIAEHDGLLCLDVATLDAFNIEHSGRAACIAKADRVPVRQGETVAVARVYPRALTREEVAGFAALRPWIRVAPFRRWFAGVVVTGAEVAAGRVRDAFGPLLTAKLEAFGSTVHSVRIVGDDPAAIAHAIQACADQGADLLFVTGGMAVDPDDVTLDGILRAGTELEFFGVPMQPATLLLLGRYNGIPLFGVPAGVLFDPYTALDRLLPWVLAGEWPAREAVMRMGAGGILAAPTHTHEPYAPHRGQTGEAGVCG